MTRKAAEPILECEGAMGEVFPGVFKTRIPQLMYIHREDRVWMLVATNLKSSPFDLIRQESYFQPANSNQGADFLWKTCGPFDMAIRQFRLDFLRHLSDEILPCPIRLVIYLESEVFAEEKPSSALAGSLARGVEKAGENASAEKHPRLEKPVGPPVARVIDASSSQFPSSLPSSLHTPEASVDAEPPVEFESFSKPDTETIAMLNSPQTPIMEVEPVTAALPEILPQSAPRRVNDVAELPGNFYQDYYGFEHMPFNNTPDSFFFFPTEKHQEALSRLIYAISERKGFVVISGEIGAGKTTLCRMLLTQLPRAIKIALITHTHLDAEQLIRAIAEDFDIPTEGLDRREIITRLNEFLIQQLAANCTVCIIIDEAQNLSPSVLEEVRMISNLETEQEKLVQLILLGQPELRDKLRDPTLKQLRQRIAVQYHLAPLGGDETLQYITHRLKMAAPTGELHFTRAAMEEVHQYSGGVPRLINTLCDNALLTCFTRQQRKITPKVIREAARDLALEPQVGGFKQFWKFW